MSGPGSSMLTGLDIYRYQGHQIASQRFWKQLWGLVWYLETLDFG